VTLRGREEVYAVPVWRLGAPVADAIEVTGQQLGEQSWQSCVDVLLPPNVSCEQLWIIERIHGTRNLISVTNPAACTPSAVASLHRHAREPALSIHQASHNSGRFGD
jgi:hypothetical protein